MPFLFQRKCIIVGHHTKERDPRSIHDLQHTVAYTFFCARPLYVKGIDNQAHICNAARLQSLAASTSGTDAGRGMSRHDNGAMRNGSRCFQAGTDAGACIYKNKIRLHLFCRFLHSTSQKRILFRRHTSLSIRGKQVLLDGRKKIQFLFTGTKQGVFHRAFLLRQIRCRV